MPNAPKKDWRHPVCFIGIIQDCGIEMAYVSGAVASPVESWIALFLTYIQAFHTAALRRMRHKGRKQ